jgi:magnesium-transporting ATPase (P-type)
MRKTKLTSIDFGKSPARLFICSMLLMGLQYFFDSYFESIDGRINLNNVNKSTNIIATAYQLIYIFSTYLMLAIPYVFLRFINRVNTNKYILCCLLISPFLSIVVYSICRHYQPLLIR